MIFQELERKEIEGLGRFYKSPKTNKWYPSITTITGHKKSEFFTNWRKNPDNERSMKISAEMGTTVHGIIEKYLNKDPSWNGSTMLYEKLMVNQLLPELDKIETITLQETSLWSDQARIAGRVDCIGIYEGKLSVIDFKTSKSPKQESYITNYFEQAAGYSLMYEELTSIRIDDIIILMTCCSGDVQVFRKKTKDYILPLIDTMKSYWQIHDFDNIQEVLG